LSNYVRQDALLIAGEAATVAASRG
jgi:hypothetical protein